MGLFFISCRGRFEFGELSTCDRWAQGATGRLTPVLVPLLPATTPEEGFVTDPLLLAADDAIINREVGDMYEEGVKLQRDKSGRKSGNDGIDEEETVEWLLSWRLK